MNIVLLSGGSGKRLWPLSNDIRSKQFIKLFDNGNDGYFSMVQRVYQQIMDADPSAKITVATGKAQKSAVLNQLGEKVGVCVEPSRRDTFPAIALAAAYMHSEKKVNREEVVIVCPVDPYVEADYFRALQRLEQAVQERNANLTLMGVTPTYPSEKYGYIIPEVGNDTVKRVLSFKEKPSKEVAEQYIKDGALWNCGAFAFRLGYLLDILQEKFHTDCYKAVYENYDRLPKISFDYAVVEKEKSIRCIEFSGAWKDVGTWNTLSEVMSHPTVGNAILGSNCENVNIINGLDVPVLAMGCKNMVIAAGADGILVSEKTESSYIKPFVEAMTQRVMYEEKSWGEFRVLCTEEHAMTVKLLIHAGKSMSYHCHQERAEVWAVLSGEGIAVLDGKREKVSAGDVIQLPRGHRHSLEALSDLDVIEIQIGKSIEDSDKA